MFLRRLRSRGLFASMAPLFLRRSSRSPSARTLMGSAPRCSVLGSPSLVRSSDRCRGYIHPAISYPSCRHCPGYPVREIDDMAETLAGRLLRSARINCGKTGRVGQSGLPLPLRWYPIRTIHRVNQPLHGPQPLRPLLQDTHCRQYQAIHMRYCNRPSTAKSNCSPLDTNFVNDPI